MKSKFTLFQGFIFLMSFLLLAANLMAQDCQALYPFKEGSFREMKSYDKKDKLTSSNRQSVLNVRDIDNGIEITVENESYDKKDKLIGQDTLTMSCQGGIFKVDMKNFLAPEAMKSLEGMEVTVDARELEFPADLQVGQQLKDGYLKVVATNMGIPILTMLVKIYDRKIEGKEDVTTPAGTFNCYKISQTVEMKTIGKYTVKSTDWVAKDVGTVRSETYDKNNEMTSYSILTEFK